MIPFGEYADRVARHIETHYGVRIVIRDIPDPLTGDLNGAEIHIDDAVSEEQRLFLLVHLFGHTVQWNIDPAAYDLGQPQRPPVATERLPALMEYEQQAARYALGLLHELGIRDADQWLSDYATCDQAYLRQYYLFGERLEFEKFWKPGSRCVGAMPIPAFTPVRRSFRSDGIVI